MISLAGLTSYPSAQLSPDKQKDTYVDHSRDISHEPHSTLHRLLGMFLKFYIVGNLSLGSKFLTARSALSTMYTSRVWMN
jgi:hypothetical protein